MPAAGVTGRAWAVAVASAITAVPGTAFASPAVAVTWDGPCDASDRVVAGVNRMVGPREGAPLSAQLRVRSTARGFSVELRTDQQGEIGTRRFDAPTCDKLAEATVLILVVLFAPVETAESVASALEGEGASRPAATTAAAPPPRQDARDALVRGPHWSFVFGPRVGAGLGVLPAPSLFASVEAGVARGRFRLAAAGTAWPERNTTGDREGVGAIALRDAGLRACFQTTSRAPHLDGCLVAEAGAFAGHGVGIAHPKSSSPFWAAAGPGIALRTEGVLASSLSLDTPIALARPSFQVGGIGEVFKPAVVSVRVAVSVDLDVP